MNPEHHILYSFRRCPYVMGARMAMHASDIQAKMVDFRLRDKPPEMLALSPKGTVPVLHRKDGAVMDESLDIMVWALEQGAPGMMAYEPADLEALVMPTRQGGWFKMALDWYKYPTRYPDEDCAGARDKGYAFLELLEARLSAQAQLCGDAITLCDLAVFPFVRQFANTDRVWFDDLPLPKLQAWLNNHLESPLFKAIFKKNKEWLIED